MNLGEKIKTLRTEAKLSQQQLADILLVSRQAVTKWETNAGIPDITNLTMLSNVFHISLDELMSGETDKKQVYFRQDANLSAYKDKINGKARGCADALVMEKYEDCDHMIALIHQIKLNKVEAILDFVIQPGLFAAADGVRSLGKKEGYFLVEKGEQQLLVHVTADYFEHVELPVKITGKKFVYDGKIFKKAYELR